MYVQSQKLHLKSQIKMKEVTPLEGRRNEKDPPNASFPFLFSEGKKREQYDLYSREVNIKIINVLTGVKNVDIGSGKIVQQARAHASHVGALGLISSTTRFLSTTESNTEHWAKRISSLLLPLFHKLQQVWQTQEQ